PDAKVILTVRDPAEWYESATRTIFRAMEPSPSRAVKLLHRFMIMQSPSLRKFMPAVRQVVWERVFDGRFADRGHAIEVFDRHIADVRERIDPCRLLVYRIQDGWNPLCAFLGAPVPAT